MSFARDNSSNDRDPPRLDGTGARSSSRDGQPGKPERDWKRTVLIAGLGTLSWVATYVGMLELIEANMGSLPLIHKGIIGFSVAMLMIMIIWLLDQLFKPHGFITKLSYAFGYVFLSIISIGFGFGFYWKVLESRGKSSRSAESAVGQVQGSLHAASTRLEQLQATLIQLTQVSTDKAELERTKGTSCPNSKPGDGPRRKMREEDAQKFQFSSEFVKGRVGAVKNDLSALNNDMIAIVSDDPATVDAKSGTRNEFMRSLSRKLDMTVTGFNAFRTDPQLKQMRADLADRAERTTFPDNRGGTYACPDPQLQTALRGVVKAIDQLPELEKPQIAAVEGSEATIEAFRRLTATFYGLLSFKLPPSADEMRELQKKAVQSVENAPDLQKWSPDQGGLSKRDYVPLAVALFVDLCLLLVSMVQAPRSRLAGMIPKMQDAERGPVIDILSRFNDIHRDPEIREKFEVFRHVVFDMNGDYYVAVPLDAPPRLNPAEREALRVEAQLLANFFASFEKERIFKRTMLPTTSSVQKRLKRQGSKFAGSEGFRVYKFTDGAWSDIILGAVMGAAKRAEQDQRTFSPSFTRPRPLETVTPELAGARQGAIAPPGPAPVIPPDAAVTGVLRAEPPFAPKPAAAAATVAAAVPPPPAAAPLRRPSHRPAPAPPVDPDHAARFGPYATAYPQRSIVEPMPPQAPRVQRPAPAPAPEAEVTVKPSGHEEDLGAAAPRDARPQPQSDPASMVGVTLARETATFSIPVAHAMASGGLKAALNKAVPEAPVQVSERPRPRLSDRVFELVPEEELEDDVEEEIKPEPLTERDMAIISRMAPPAAE